MIHGSENDQMFSHVPRMFVEQEQEQEEQDKEENEEENDENESPENYVCRR